MDRRTKKKLLSKTTMLSEEDEKFFHEKFSKLLDHIDGAKSELKILIESDPTNTVLYDIRDILNQADKKISEEYDEFRKELNEYQEDSEAPYLHILEEMSIPQLKQEAKKAGFKGYSNKTRDQLLNLFRSGGIQRV